MPSAATFRYIGGVVASAALVAVSVRCIYAEHVTILHFLRQIRIKLRKSWHAKLRPERIILIRHGESVGNVDKSVFSCVHDSNILLTDNGWRQSKQVGRELRSMLGSGWTCVFLSPYARAKQTLCGILSELEPEQVERMKFREDPRLREQEFGNLGCSYGPSLQQCTGLCIIFRIAPSRRTSNLPRAREPSAV